MGISNGPRENEIQRGIDRICAGFPFIVKIKMYFMLCSFKRTMDVSIERTFQLNRKGANLWQRL